jgi:hypothetical protein
MQTDINSWLEPLFDAAALDHVKPLLVFASLKMTIPARFSGVCPPTNRCAG